MAEVVSSRSRWPFYPSFLGCNFSGNNVRTKSVVSFRRRSCYRASDSSKGSAEEESTRDSASLGRREALLSMVAGWSVSSTGSAALESGVEREIAAEKLDSAALSNWVGKPAGVTSEYVRPPFASPDLPLQNLLASSRRTAAPNSPSQVWVCHYGRNHTQVSWITSGAGGSSVEYGLTSGNYTGSATGTSSTYTYAPSGYTSGHIHYAVIGPLADDTNYFYRMGGVGSEFSFKTPPPSGPDVPILFAVVGDLGQTSNSQSTLKHIQSSSYDMLILPGDLSYADEYQPRWDSYGELVSPVASGRPWMVTQGNHEIENNGFQAYNARWNMPYQISGSDSNLYYSFEVAGVHFLILGSYTDYSQTSAQYLWLQKDLATVDRSKTPWLIGVIHAPWYNSNEAHQGDGDGMLAAMEDLLVAAKVDIIFAGHVHAYERGVRIYKGQPNDCGILYINIGDGGNREGLALHYLNPQPAWSVFREASFGHGELQINNGTSAVWTWHRNQDGESVISDSVEITSLSAAPSKTC